MALPRKMISKIKVAQGQLGLSDAEYRKILREKFRKKSCTELSLVQANQLIRIFQSMGWEPQGWLPGVSQGIQDDRQSKKIQALWITLHQAGVIRDGSDKALMSFCKRMTKTADHPGKDHLRFCIPAERSVIIETLKSMAKREGVDVG
ncbi:regulatory protein GemA [Desulfobulbus sp.]|uniref:regulatory protein GemA n=1 Tax=Desulfobulbus sp. TaxID=895 RepID=UPI00286F17B9|nr:regulatory protein GemA [Desulfobulbus sp.]